MSKLIYLIFIFGILRPSIAYSSAIPVLSEVAQTAKLTKQTQRGSFKKLKKRYTKLKKKPSNTQSVEGWAGLATMILLFLGGTAMFIVGLVLTIPWLAVLGLILGIFFLLATLVYLLVGAFLGAFI